MTQSVGTYILFIASRPEPRSEQNHSPRDHILPAQISTPQQCRKNSANSNIHLSDLVAMSVNDIVVQGAEPLIFLDTYTTNKLNVDVAVKVVEGICEACK